MNKRLATVALTLGLAGAGATGIGLIGAGASSAQTASTDTTAAASTAAPTTRPDPGKWEADALAPLVADGTLTQAQADAVTKALEAARPQGGPGRGHGVGGPGLEAAATAIGVSTDDLRTALQGGQTIAQVAESKGVSAQTVIDAMKKELTDHLAADVTAGRITQAQADARLADADARLAERVNSTAPAGHEGRGPGGPEGTPPADAATSTTSAA